MLDISFKTSLPPKKGRILLSDPFLGDEYFQRSAIFLCEHSKNGSFGFVLNNYVTVEINELNNHFPEIKTNLSLGGPVETERLYFLHTLGKELNESLELNKGIFIGGDFEQLTNMITESHFKYKQIRFFLGYAGWEAKQLQAEIKNNHWIVSDEVSIDEVMDVSLKDPWKYFMQKLGIKYSVISRFPLNPNDN